MTDADRKTQDAIDALEARSKNHPSDRETVRTFLLSALFAFVGIREIGESNRGYWIDKFFKSLGMQSGLAWCLAVIQYIYLMIARWFGIKDLIPFNTAGTVRLGRWAIEKGYAVTSWRDVRPGDLIVWRNGRKSDKGHVEAITAQPAGTMKDPDLYHVETVGGNTSNKNYREGGLFIDKEYFYLDADISPIDPPNCRYILCVISFDKLYDEAVK